MRKLVALLLLLAFSLAPGGCSAVSPETAEPAAYVSGQAAEPGLLIPEKGTGRLIENEEARRLNAAQKRLLTDYMNACYESLAALELCDLTPLFAGTCRENAAVSNLLLSYQIAVRKMQNEDLSLSAYRYTLTCTEIEEDEEGRIRIMAMEDSTQNFTAWPGVDAQRFDAWHAFVLTEEEGRWCIADHQDSFAYVMDESNPLPETLSEAALNAYEEALLAEARHFTAQKTQTVTRAEDALTVAHAYDRTAAVAYAERYYASRNPAWPDYSVAGGNCQNFVSQSLLAGGIPMDTQGEAVWHYSGPGLGASGRSTSWAGVRSFYDYAAGNTGFGLAAAADEPFFSGAPGDVILMGPGSELRHAVIIVGLLQNTQGQTVDYLINSNTANLRHFPAAAYPYPHQVLIHILGWNE